MRAFLLYIVLLFPFSGCIFDKVNPENTGQFIKFLGTAFDEKAFAMESTPDGGFVIVGATDSLKIRKSMFIAKTDKNGNRQWLKKIGNPNTDYEARDVIVKEDGNMVVLGYTTEIPVDFFFGSCRFFLIELTSDGEIISTQIFGTKPLQPQGEFYLTKSADGGVILLGNVFEGNENSKSDMYVLKLDMNMSVVFEQTYGIIDRNDDLGSMIEANDGDLIWCGTSNRQTTPLSSDLRITRADVFGNLKWDLLFNENDGLKQMGKEIQVLTDGSGFVAVGTDSSQADNKDVLIILVDNNGEVIWQKKWEVVGNQEGTSISPTNDGGYIISGTIEENDKKNVLLLKIDSDGNAQWYQSFGKTTEDDFGQIVRQSTEDEGFLVLSTFRFSNNTVIGLIKTNKEGKISN